MCGILGAVGSARAPLSPELRVRLRAAVDRIAHRGPDSTTYLGNHDIELAFTRLAIVGVEYGEQPFISRDGCVVVAVNGEIFNHTALRSHVSDPQAFTTQSDCEVVLHLYEKYGLSCVDLLDGMFAIFIWDGRQRKAFLIRDRLGIKPLFLHVHHGVFTFASEIKALIGLPNRPVTFDWEAAFSEPWLIGAPVLAAEHTLTSFFTGIDHVPAGAIVTWDIEQCRLSQSHYWTLTHAKALAESYRDAEPATLIEEYRERLTTSVHKCLMSEVEVGLFLSGGIDSAAVAALAKSHEPFHSFTVISPTTLASGDYPNAQALAAHLGLPLHGACFPVPRVQDYAQLWPQLLRLCETPYCGPEQLFKYGLYACAKMLRPTLKVMLSGQGSDEFNGGYSSLFTGRDATWPTFIRQLELLYQGDVLHHRAGFARFWEQYLGPGLFHSAWLQASVPSPNVLWQRYVAEKARDLQMYNLWHEDRLAAGHGIENRVPFLDHHLVELCLAVPESLRATLFWDKTILRAAMAGIVPDQFRSREKVPFFYGSGVEATARLMLELLCANDYALVEQACVSGNTFATVVNRDRLFQLLHDKLASNDTTNWDMLVRLLNMGLLEGICQEWQTAAPCSERTVVLQTVSHLETLADNACVRAGLQLPDVRRHPDLVLRIPDNVRITRPVHLETGHLLVLMDQMVAFEIDHPSLIEFLERLHGEKPFAEIVASMTQHDETIYDLVNEALEAHVLEVPDKGEQLWSSLTMQ